MTRDFAFALCVSAFGVAPAHAAADATWHPVMVKDARGMLPQLPPPSQLLVYDHFSIADGGAGQLGFTAAMTASSLNLWGAARRPVGTVRRNRRRRRDRSGPRQHGERARLHAAGAGYVFSNPTVP